jgi:hypothetical protein
VGAAPTPGPEGTGEASLGAASAAATTHPTQDARRATPTARGKRIVIVALVPRAAIPIAHETTGSWASDHFGRTI